MDYQHQLLNHPNPPLPLGKVVCVGRNYTAHIHELKNAVPDEPVLFIKPITALAQIEQPLILPSQVGECHHELEISVLIGKKLKNCTAQEAQDAIVGYGLALDLTLRDCQTELKKKGLPWEKAKAFDFSCPLSSFIPKEEIQTPQDLEFSLTVNGKLRQQGNTQLMRTPTVELILYISQFFTLLPGDVILTGTPEGVGALYSGDSLLLELDRQYQFHTEIKENSLKV